MTNALAMKNDQHGLIDVLRGELAPLGKPRNDNGEWTPDAARIGRALSPLGAKVSPTIAPEQGKAWRVAMVMALSDLPAEICLEAIADAMHQPIRFLSEAEEVIRRCAARRIRLVEIQLATQEQAKLNSLPAPAKISLEETTEILEAEWPTHGRVDAKTLTGALKIPNKADAAAYAEFFKQWQIAPSIGERN